MDAHQKVLFVDAATGYYRITRFPVGDFYGPVDLGLYLAEQHEINSKVNCNRSALHGCLHLLGSDSREGFSAVIGVAAEGVRGFSQRPRRRTHPPRRSSRVDVRDLVDMYTRSRSEGFGAETKRRIMLGTYSLSSGYYDAYYLKGLKVRTLIKNDFDEAFKRCDVIVTPTAPTTAFNTG